MTAAAFTKESSRGYRKVGGTSFYSNFSNFVLWTLFPETYS